MRLFLKLFSVRLPAKSCYRNKMDDFMKVMMPDESPSSSPLTPVHTLAFIDLETTGLPYEVGKKNVHITELSIVAVDRQHFELDFKLRVMQKVNIFIKPRAPISCGASSITGLYNDMLEFQKPFDESVLKLLEAFLSRLRSPICLIAHNGNRFDFPLLQAEIKRLGLSLPPDITCADTLDGFRTFGLVEPANQTSSNMNPIEKSISGMNNTVCVENGNDPIVETNEVPQKEIDSLLSTDIELFEEVDEAVCSDSPTTDSCSLEIIPTVKPPVPVIDLTEDIKITNNVPSISYGNKTPEINVEAYNKIPPRLCSKKQTFDITACDPQKIASVKRKLFDSPNTNISKLPKSNVNLNGNKNIVKGAGFSLEKIYVHYFGEMPDCSHQADADCINLCKICQKINSTFLPWLDENQVLFSEISSMW